MSVAWVGAAIAAVGVIAQSSSASKAKKAQEKAAAEANAAGKDIAGQQTALQREMFERQVTLNQPALDRSNAAGNQLSMFLGLNTPQQAQSGAQPTFTREQIRAQLLPQFSGEATSSGATPGGGNRLSGLATDGGLGRNGNFRRMLEDGPTSANGAGVVDEAGLEAAITARLAQQAATPQSPSASSNPLFGSLMKDFSKNDFESDPGYQFRVEEGQKALERSAAARGGLMSGSALKDTVRLSQGLASQDYQAAFDRFQVNRANKLNPLLSMTGAGQVAIGALGQAGQSMANGIGNALGQYGQNLQNNITGAGNARASGYIAQGNAITNGLQQGFNSYQQQQYLNNMNNSTYRTPAGQGAGSTYSGYTLPSGGGGG